MVITFIKWNKNYFDLTPSLLGKTNKKKQEIGVQVQIEPWIKSKTAYKKQLEGSFLIYKINNLQFDLMLNVYLNLKIPIFCWCPLQDLRGLVMSIFNWGIYGGIGLSFPVGRYITELDAWQLVSPKPTYLKATSTRRPW